MWNLVSSKCICDQDCLFLLFLCLNWRSNLIGNDYQQLVYSMRRAAIRFRFVNGVRQEGQVRAFTGNTGEVSLTFLAVVEEASHSLG